VKKTAFVTTALAGLICILSGTLRGQSTYHCPLPPDPDHCHWFWSGENAPPPFPVGTQCCNPFGSPFAEVCSVPTNRCRVPSAPDEICLTCLLNALQPIVGLPINVSTGNTFITQTDISVPGLGGGLSLSRTWNSKLPAIQSSVNGMFGMNWRSNYEERLITNSPDQFLKRTMGDGSVWSYGFASFGAGTSAVFRAAAPANDTTTITSGDTIYTWVGKNGEKKTFDTVTGALLSLVDRNGNTTQLAYDATHRLATVTDPVSRHLTFTYVGPTSPLVSTVTSDVGITVTYAYDAQGRLTMVTKPDGTTVSFDYDAQSRITAVRDSAGKVLEAHTYDVLGRGLSSSRVNGVESVTVSYPQ